MGGPQPLPEIPGYELIEPIGSGSYGTVWKARSVTGGLRAVKIVRRSSFSEDRPYEREFAGLRRFAEVSLREPRQLALLHVGRDDAAGLFYYVMELADDLGPPAGPYLAATVKALMDPSRRPAAEQVVRLGCDMARALASLHSSGLIHRDIKPENIILVRGVPKLADIGLVADADSTQTVLGTKGYTPEIGGGRPSGDVYALGKVLYELAFGLRRDEFPRLPPDVDRHPDWPLLNELNAIILRACDENVGNRYPDGAAILKDLVLLEAGESILRLRNNERRLALARRTGLILAALAILGTALGVWQAQVAARERELAVRTAKAERTALRALERSRLSQAEAEIGSRRLGRARSFLREIYKGDPTHASFEWRVLWNEAGGDPSRVLDPAPTELTALALSPDGTRIAGLTRHEQVLMWNTSSGRILATNPAVQTLGGFSTQRQSWVVGGADSHVQFLPARSGPGAGAAEPPAGGGAEGVLQALLPDGRMTVFASEAGTDLLRLLAPDGRTPEAVLTLGSPHPDRWPRRTASAPNGRFAVVERLVGGDLATGFRLELGTFEAGTLFRTNYLDEVAWALAISPDSRWLAAGLAASGDVVLFELPGLREHHRLHGDHSTMITALAFSPDSRQLATGSSDAGVRVWTLESARVASTLFGHPGQVTAVTWLPSGTGLITGDNTGDVRVWDLSLRAPVTDAGGFIHKGRGATTFSRDGRTIATTDASGDVVILTNGLDTATGIRLRGASEPLAFVREDRELLTTAPDLSVQVWDTATGRKVRDAGRLHLTASNITQRAVSADGRWLASLGRSGMISFLDLETGRQTQATNEAEAIALAAYGTKPQFLTGGPSGIVRIWDPSENRMIWSLKATPSEIYDLAAMDGGDRIVTGDQSGAVHVVDVSQRSVLPPLFPAGGELNCIALSRDNSRLACGYGSGAVVLLDTGTWEEQAAFRLNRSPRDGANEAVERLMFSETGGRLMGRSPGGHVRIWETD